MDSVAVLIWIVSFVILTVTVTGAAGRFGLSAPLLLVAIGAVVSFVPAVPTIEIQPDLVLYGVLPPLLFASAIRTSLLELKAHLDSILALSVGLVAFTFLVVGVTTWLVIPGITLAAGLAFGAVVAPTDAVAVTAIAGRLRLPRRLRGILESESLLNDAVAIVALTSSITAIVGTVNAVSVSTDLLLAVGVGVGMGLLVGAVIVEIRKRLRSPVLDTSLSLVTPYVAFIPAQLLHGSGVLSVVLAGLLLGYRSPVIQSAEARIAESLNWRTIRFLLENAVFLLIGLSLAGIVAEALADGPGLWPSVLVIVAVLIAVAGSRVVWVALVTAAYRSGASWMRERSWSWNNSTAVAVSGIRGVVTLVAVFLLPAQTPSRGFLQFLAFVVIAASLLGGLALPAVIRRLRLPPPNAEQERTQRHLLMGEVQSAGLRRLEEAETEDVEERVIHRLQVNETFFLDQVEDTDEELEPWSRLEDYARLRREMIEAEREALVAARAEGRYEEYAVRAVLAAIDAEEIVLRATSPRTGAEGERRRTESGTDAAEENRRRSQGEKPRSR